MSNIRKIQDLKIASEKFDVFNKIHLKELDYKKWKNYINNSDLFIWYEDTENAKNILANIDSVPIDFKDTVLSNFNKTRCYMEYNFKKKYYNITIVFYAELKYIKISIERKVKIEDLRLFLDMANYLDAYLLYNGNEIIDEKIIDGLE